MSGKNYSEPLKIDTNYSSEFSVPGLALSSTSESTVTSPCSPETPQHQPTMTGEERSDKAKAFVQNLGLQWDGLDNGAKIRAKKLMSEDYSWSPTKHQNNIMEDNQRYKTTFREEFTKFCSLLDDKFDLNAGAAWMDGSRVFFDEQALDEYLVIRKQLSGICCLHASVVWQHYLQSLKSDRRGSRDHKMLDISNFLRDKLPKHRQQQYIETGACGLGSEEFFRMITGVEDFMLNRVQLWPKSVNREMHQLDVDQILENFERYGTPGLVSMFIIEEDFHHQMVFSEEVDKAKCREYAQKKGKAKGDCIRHSMVLLGVHKDEKGEVWLLLQNFWEGNYFRLVTAEYLASCHTTISWVGSPTCDVSLQDDPFVVDAEYAETDMEFEECPPPVPEEW